MSKAFLAVEHGQPAFPAGFVNKSWCYPSCRHRINAPFAFRRPVHIEDIQDQVELALMRSGEHDIAKAYVLYREKHAAERASQHTILRKYISMLMATSSR